jgi:uncharacterized membrane protein
MKKIIFPTVFASLFFASCSFEKAEPLTLGCSTTMSFASDIKSFIDSKCVTCHAAGGSGTGDFSDFNVFKSKADDGTLKARVFISKDMAPALSPQLTEEELGKLKCWMEQGAQNN